MRRTVLLKSRRIDADGQVRATLDALRAQGFVVVHGSEQDGDGTVDHLVSGPTGLFLINTCTRRLGNEQLQETWRRAEEMFQQLHSWVTPVVCLTSGGGSKARRQERVWVVSQKKIVEWISTQRNPVLQLERVADLSERLGRSSPVDETSSEVSPANWPRSGVAAVSDVLLGRTRSEQDEVEPGRFEPLLEGDPSI